VTPVEAPECSFTGPGQYSRNSTLTQRRLSGRRTRKAAADAVPPNGLFVDKLRTPLALFGMLVGVLVLYAILAAFLYQFGVEQHATSIRL
jgi:hypothetical protein